MLYANSPQTEWEGKALVADGVEESTKEDMITGQEVHVHVHVYACIPMHVCKYEHVVCIWIIHNDQFILF